MKKFIFIILVIILSSCGVVTYTTIGDITRKDYNGNVIDTWKGATIMYEEPKYNSYTKTTYTQKYAFDAGSSGVLNFVDSDGNSHYIQGGIITIDNIRKYRIVDNIYTDSNGKTTIIREQSDEKAILIQTYKELKSKLDYYRSQLRHFRKGSQDYNRAKRKIDELNEALKTTQRTLWTKYNVDYTKL